MEETQPYDIKPFKAIHETFGEVSGVTCKEWPKLFRYCFFYRSSIAAQEQPRSRFCCGSTFEKIQVEE
jgi:hypothetical protein